MDNSLRFLRSSLFWAGCLPTLVIAGAFFAWELRLIDLPLPDLPRFPATPFEIIFSFLLAFLLALAVGLFGWQRRYGACPAGARRSAGIAGALGGLALLCPVCLALPVSLVGLSTLFALLIPFLPLIRLIAFLFALLAVWLLWPRTIAPKNGRAKTIA